MQEFFVDEVFGPDDPRPMTAVQEQMATVVRAVEELARGFSEAVLKWQAAAVEADKLRTAFEAVSDSRGRWKTRALEASANSGRPAQNQLADLVIDALPDATREIAETNASDAVYRQNPWTPSTMDGVRATLSEAVGQAIGTGSRCWKGSGAAAVFDDRKARWVVDGLVVWLSDWAGEIRREANEATASKIKLESTRLLNYALNLRMYGERAPGGDETWAGFDREAESFLRSLGRREHTDPGPSV